MDIGHAIWLGTFKQNYRSMRTSSECGGLRKESPICKRGREIRVSFSLNKDTVINQVIAGPEAHHTDLEVTAFAGEFQQRGVSLGTIDTEPVGHAHSRRPDDDAIFVGRRATIGTREAKILRAIHSDLRSNFQQCDLALINEPPNLRLVAPQQSRDILSRTIADANPNDFRRRARQDAQAVRVFVFRDENAVTLAGELPGAGELPEADPPSPSAPSCRAWRESGRTSRMSGKSKRTRNRSTRFGSNDPACAHPVPNDDVSRRPLAQLVDTR